MPKAMVRLSAGRREMGEPVQALCFLSGANSIFYGDKLLTTGNPEVGADRALFAKLGLTPLDLSPEQVTLTLIAELDAALDARRSAGLDRHRVELNNAAGSTRHGGRAPTRGVRQQRLPGPCQRSRHGRCRAGRRFTLGRGRRCFASHLRTFSAA